jgi:hypothetical protein
LTGETAGIYKGLQMWTMLWEQGVASSNPAAPTNEINGLRKLPETSAPDMPQKGMVAALQQVHTRARHLTGK